MPATIGIAAVSIAGKARSYRRMTCFKGFRVGLLWSPGCNCFLLTQNKQ